MKTRQITPRKTAPAIVGLGLTLMAASCGLLPADEPVRDQDSGEIVESGDISAFSLRVGDCINSEDLEEVFTQVEAIPCDQPHDSEIYAELELEKGDFPGDDTIEAQADTFCVENFEEYVGVAPGRSALYYMPMTPSQKGWEFQDDRKIQCLVTTQGEPTTTLLKGSGR